MGGGVIPEQSDDVPLADLALKVQLQPFEIAQSNVLVKPMLVLERTLRLEDIEVGSHCTVRRIELNAAVAIVMGF